MATFVNRAKVATSTTGTGTITLGAAEDGYQTFAAAGVADGNTVRYTIEDGNNWEIGTGTYTATGTTLSRSPSESSNAGAAINLSGNAIVFVTALATDFTSPTYTNLTATGTVDFTGATVSDLGTVTTANIDGGDIASAVTINKSPTVTLAGDATGSATFTNLGNATLTVTVVDDSHNHIISNVDGLQTALNAKQDASTALTTSTTFSGDVSGTYNAIVVADDSHNHIISNVDGLQTALDGKLGATAAAVSANKWTTARTVSLTGAVTGSASVDGSANVSIATTATSDPTLTLSGDATGSATFTNLGNATLSVTVVDDSHNHVISNVDGLQTALDGKQAASTALGYVDVATGNYGTIKVDDDRGVTWAGYAIRDDWVFMSNGAGAAGIYNDTNNAWNIYFEQNASTSLRWGGDGSEQATTENGYFAANNQMRAPIFYDSNNTAFYSDPAGATILNYLRLDSTAEYQLYTNNQYLNIRYGSTGAGGIRLYDSGNVLQGYWYGSGTGEHGFLDNDGSWAVRVRTGTSPLILYCNANDEFYVYTTYTYSPGSSRAPIFYDSNNTAYYFDGHSTGDSIRVAGDIVAYYSDERLKTNLGNIESPVDKVKQLNGFKYHANELGAKHGYDPEKIQVGVSAQEVEAVLPEVVRDAPIGHGYKTVQYERLVPLLIEAIKEQAGQIEALQAEVAKLKG